MTVKARSAVWSGWRRCHGGARAGEIQAAEGAVAFVSGPGEPGGPVRLLLVEDEALIALMLEDMVEGMGCAVTGLAPRVALGVAMAETGHFDMAILDVNVAGENVEPVAERLAARGVPFIFATGYGLAGIAPDFARTPTLAKPYSPQDLEATLASVVEGRSSKN